MLSLFKENCQNVTFGDEGHNYETLDEMESKNPASLSCFLVQGFLPHAEIVIRGSHKARLNVQRSTLFVVERNNPKADLLFFSVKDFLLTRKWYSRITMRYTLLTVGTVLVIALLFSKSLLRTHDGSDFPYNLAGATSKFVEADAESAGMDFILCAGEFFETKRIFLNET